MENNAFPMEDVVNNNDNAFCNRKCDEGGFNCFDDSSSQQFKEFRACCEFEPARKDCLTPGMGANFEPPSGSAPAVEFVRQFASNELNWVDIFLRAWKKATENGFKELMPLGASCPKMMIDFGMPATNTRCAGKPILRDGCTSPWGCLGTRVTRHQCQQACLDDPECAFAIYDRRAGKNLCSGFTSCSSPYKEIAWTPEVFEKVPIASYFAAVGAGKQRCTGNPNGKGWDGLGFGTLSNCLNKCQKTSECNFAVFNPISGGCSSFASCSFRPVEDWSPSVWKKL